MYTVRPQVSGTCSCQEFGSKELIIKGSLIKAIDMMACSTHKYHELAVLLFVALAKYPMYKIHSFEKPDHLKMNLRI